MARVTKGARHPPILTTVVNAARAKTAPRRRRGTQRRPETRRAGARPSTTHRRRGASGRANVRRGAEPERATQTAARRVSLPPRWRVVAKTVLKLGAVAGFAWGLAFGAHEAYDYATTSPRFEVRSLIFEPSAHVDDDTLRGLLGLERGTNILALEPGQLAERVAAHPWVREATVLRHLPDTLEVRVVEREAKAVLLADDFYLVDAHGQPFKRVESGERGQLPVITGVGRRELLTAHERAQEALQRALGALETYQAKRRPRLSEIHLAQDGGLDLYTAESGTHLRVGRTDIQHALARYDALRAALGSRAEELEVVHLDAERRPGARERVVARFADPATEQRVIAEGIAARGPRAVDAAAEASNPTSEPSAPKRLEKRRIPRY